MKIVELKVSGYRSLKHVTWKPGDLNVIIGPNCAGKSNLLRFIEIMAASAKGKLSRYIQTEGGMGAVVWDGKARGISCTMKTAPAGESPDTACGGLDYRVDLLRLGQGSAFRVDHEWLNWIGGDADPTDPGQLFEHMPGVPQGIVFDKHRQTVLVFEEIPEEETFLSEARGAFSFDERIPRFRRALAGWRVYRDWRVDQEAPIRSAVVTRSEQAVAPDGQNLVNVLHTSYTGDRDFKNDIDAAMCAAFGDDFEELVFPPAADQRIQLGVRWKSLSRHHSAADLSDGALRFLLLLATLGTPSPPPLIAIDEPATGLHPAMLPIVAEFAVEASRRSQVILTTHSPQLLDAFRDTIPTTTVATWDEGETHLTVLPEDSLGEWLKEYSLGKLFTAGDLEGMA